MGKFQLVSAAKELVSAMDQVADTCLPEEISNIVKTHAKIGAGLAIAGGWVPAAGSALLVASSATCIWTMYARINKALGLSLGSNIIKTLAGGVATNLAAFALGSLIGSAILSFIPGIGSTAAAILDGAISYALCLASGYVYIRILTTIFKSGDDPTTFSIDKLKQIMSDVLSNEKSNIKDLMKSSKSEYKNFSDEERKAPTQDYSEEELEEFENVDEVEDVESDADEVLKKK